MVAGVCPETDPVVLARRMGFEPDLQQEAVLRSTARQGILNCSRQWGKSTTMAAKAVHRMVTGPGTLVVIAAPSEKQAAETVMKAWQMVAALGLRRRRDGIHKVSMVLPNGSRMVGVPANEATVRGISKVGLLIIDEASRVSDAMYHAVRPMVVMARGDIWLMSTPWSAFGFFYEVWEHGGPDWERFRVKATECARIPKDWLEAERRAVGEWAFRRDYLTEFVQDDLSAFEAAVVEDAMDDGVGAITIDWLDYAKGRLA